MVRRFSLVSFLVSLPFAAAGTALVGGTIAACSSSNGTKFNPNSTEYTAPDGNTSALESPGTCTGATGGSVIGPEDHHCELPDGGIIAQRTTAAGCMNMTPAPGGGMDDAGVPDSGDPCPGDMNAYGPVLYNNWGADDDCKFDVSWQSTPICKGQPAYFTVLVTNRSDGTPALGVQIGGKLVPTNPRPDVVLDCRYPIPNVPVARDPSPAVAPGTYVVGPVVFDKSGDWVFRFHFNEECLDSADDSPHGHAAFFVHVP